MGCSVKQIFWVGLTRVFGGFTRLTQALTRVFYWQLARTYRERGAESRSVPSGVEYGGVPSPADQVV